MFKKFSRIAITLFLGVFGGLALVDYLAGIAAAHAFFSTTPLNMLWVQYSASIIILAICTLLAWLLSKGITEGIIKLTAYIDKWQSDKSVSDLMLMLIAVLIGLLMAYLCGSLTNRIPSTMIALTVNVVLYLLFPYMCVRILWKRMADFPSLFKRKDSKKRAVSSAKILDASAIMDGRIYDVCKAGFIEGQIIIPEFAVQEIMLIADSEDSLKRNRARRALDIIKALSDELKLPVEVRSISYEDITDNDTMLLRFATENNAAIITTDYNMNKSAALHKVKVLNVNELTNALKVALIPGDILNTRILKAGKEKNQGLAYLDDGTMIVVENGFAYVGQTCDVTVTNVMQTAAGRMIFARIAD